MLQRFGKECMEKHLNESSATQDRGKKLLLDSEK